MKAYFFLFILCFISGAYCGPLAYAVCQSGCNALVVSCYAAAGAVFGTVTGGSGVPAAITSCNTGLGICMSACIAAGCAPTL
ncbi:zygote-specific protein-like protein [Sporodiniella umbellata]|nr:zygote-specific protein-like protein [Sporodiniella umbellata]